MSVAFMDAVPVYVACSSAVDELDIICVNVCVFVFCVSVIADVVASSGHILCVAFDMALDIV